MTVDEREKEIMSVKQYVILMPNDLSAEVEATSVLFVDGYIRFFMFDEYSAIFNMAIIYGFYDKAIEGNKMIS